jgi:hypothetical protein
MDRPRYRLVIAGALLFITSLCYSAWKFNPFTGKLDYYGDLGKYSTADGTFIRFDPANDGDWQFEISESSSTFFNQLYAAEILPGSWIYMDADNGIKLAHQYDANCYMVGRANSGIEFHTGSATPAVEMMSSSSTFNVPVVMKQPLYIQDSSSLWVLTYSIFGDNIPICFGAAGNDMHIGWNNTQNRLDIGTGGTVGAGTTVMQVTGSSIAVNVPVNVSTITASIDLDLFTNGDVDDYLRFSNIGGLTPTIDIKGSGQLYLRAPDDDESSIVIWKNNLNALKLASSAEAAYIVTSGELDFYSSTPSVLNMAFCASSATFGVPIYGDGANITGLDFANMGEFTEAALEAKLSNVTDVYTENDGILISTAPVTNGATGQIPACDDVYDFCETTQDYLKTSEQSGGASMLMIAVDSVKVSSPTVAISFENVFTGLANASTVHIYITTGAVTNGETGKIPNSDQVYDFVEAGYESTVAEGTLTDSVIVSADIKNGEIVAADMTAATTGWFTNWFNHANIPTDYAVTISSPNALAVGVGYLISPIRDYAYTISSATLKCIGGTNVIMMVEARALNAEGSAGTDIFTGDITAVPAEFRGGTANDFTIPANYGLFAVVTSVSGDPSALMIRYKMRHD